MTWIEITATFDQTPEDWSPWIEIFRDHGCENTIQTDDPPTLGAAVVDLTGSQQVVDALTLALQQAGAKQVTSKPFEEQNWDELWRSHFHPRRIGDRIVVRPTWEEFDAKPTDVEIVLDPGQAFGTGDHPTTRMCLELLEQVEIEGRRVADVGCGSGILSIAAKKLGAMTVEGVDIEPLSVEVARENAQLNAADCDFRTGDSIRDLSPEPFDLVVSNIISAILIAMATDFSAALSAGGAWIASGIIEQNWPDVLAAGEKAGFRLDEIKREDGWVAARLARSA